MVDSLDPSNPADAAVIDELKSALGDLFAEQVMQDATWARTILGTVPAS
jgi:hypothetical protein